MQGHGYSPVYKTQSSNSRVFNVSEQMAWRSQQEWFEMWILPIFPLADLGCRISNQITIQNKTILFFFHISTIRWHHIMSFAEIPLLFSLLQKRLMSYKTLSQVFLVWQMQWIIINVICSIQILREYFSLTALTCWYFGYTRIFHWSRSLVKIIWTFSSLLQKHLLL